MSITPTTSIHLQPSGTSSDLLGFWFNSSRPSTIEPPTTHPPLIQGSHSSPACDPRCSVTNSTVFPMLTSIVPATFSSELHRDHDHYQTASCSITITLIWPIKLSNFPLIVALPYHLCFDIDYRPEGALITIPHHEIESSSSETIVLPGSTGASASGVDSDNS